MVKDERNNNRQQNCCVPQNRISSFGNYIDRRLVFEIDPSHEPKLMADLIELVSFTTKNR